MKKIILPFILVLCVQHTLQSTITLKAKVTTNDAVGSSQSVYTTAFNDKNHFTRHHGNFIIDVYLKEKDQEICNFDILIKKNGAVIKNDSYSLFLSDQTKRKYTINTPYDFFEFVLKTITHHDNKS